MFPHGMGIARYSWARAPLIGVESNPSRPIAGKSALPEQGGIVWLDDGILADDLLVPFCTGFRSSLLGVVINMDQPKSS